ncbi:MAG: hypothetical protein OEX19_12355 [Gammaproteobacteria bacterium]|nr:hypothetical protein [Gammaproteobacteria bacterium]
MTDTEKKDHALEFAESKARHANLWFTVFWWTYLWFFAIGLVLSIAVPFGLTLLLYIEDQDTKQLINISLIIISCIALILSVIGNIMRFRERAIWSREQRNRIEESILRYRENNIQKDEFLEQISGFLKEDHKEDTP